MKAVQVKRENAWQWKVYEPCQFFFGGRKAEGRQLGGKGEYVCGYTYMYGMRGKRYSFEECVCGVCVVLCVVCGV